MTRVHTALARAFADEGVTTVFGLMGTGNMDWMLDMTRLPGVRVHQVRHEGAALTMAEGWARATGEPGVAAVTEGPGVTQLTTALTVATRAGVPVIVYAADSPIGEIGHAHSIDQQALVEPTGAAFIGVYEASEALVALREAFYRARVERRPVVVNVPMDVARHEIDDSRPYEPSTSLLQPRGRVRPDDAALAEAVDLIAAAQRPVLIAGQGAVRSGADAAILRLAERVGGLLATTLHVQGWLESEWDAGIAGAFATPAAARLFADADLVIGVGSSMDERTLRGGAAFPRARFIHIDTRAPYRMGTGEPATSYLQGDALTTVELLHDLLAERGHTATGYRRDDVRRQLQDGELDPEQFDIEPGRLDPRSAATALDEALPADVGLVFGLGHQMGISTIHMRRRRPFRQWTAGFFCIGNGMPAAIGAALALAPRRVAAIEGDAGLMMHLAELDTAVRLGVNLLVVVMNDEGLGAEFMKLRSRNQEEDPALIATPDLGAVARSLGARGRLARSLDDIRGAVDEFMAGEGPMLLDVRISRSVPSLAYRRQFFGASV